MLFPSFFEIEGPGLAPIEFEKWNRAKNKAILLSDLIDENASDQQKKQLQIAIKKANELEEIAYAAYDRARARSYGRGS